MRHRTWGPPEETLGTVCGDHLGRHPEERPVEKQSLSGRKMSKQTQDWMLCVGLVIKDDAVLYCQNSAGAI